jgi:hypothetical protein
MPAERLVGDLLGGLLGGFWGGSVTLREGLSRHLPYGYYNTLVLPLLSTIYP